MKPAKLYQYFNLLSIDVVLGAFCSAILATRLLDVKMGFAWWLSLVCAIWVIYTADHLIDSLKLENPTGKRRIFYAQHFAKLKYSIIIVSITSVLMSFLLLDLKIILFGISLGLLAVAYLIIVFMFGKQMKIWLQKELSVAVIYTIGIWGSVIIESNKFPPIEILLILFVFFMLVLADILIFSIIEHDLDKKNHFISLIGMIGERKARRLVYLSLIVALLPVIPLILCSFGKYQIAAIILATMAGFLYLIFRFEEKLIKNETYRYLGEAVFFLPAFIVLV